MQSTLRNWSLIAILGGVLIAVAAIGCQTSVGGQTYPSAYYLHDDVEYHPAGPESPLSNQIQALEEHKLEQQALQQGLDLNAP